MSSSFNADGYLAAGIHRMNRDDFEATFVTAFPFSSTRSDIFDRYGRHSSELLALINDCYQFMDGSFVSNKADPGDVDMVVFVDADAVDKLSPQDQAKFMALVDSKGTRATHMCDAYFVATYPPGHAGEDVARINRKYWMGEFGFDRSDTPKGFVQLDLTNLVPPVVIPIAGPSSVSP